MTNTLEIKHLCVSVDGQELLHDIDLTIPQGEVHALLGPNGSGKTSLLMSIMGYPQYKVIQGRILFDGRDIAELDLTQRARLGIGVVHQRPPTIVGVKLRQILDHVTAGDPERVEEIAAWSNEARMGPFLGCEFARLAAPLAQDAHAFDTGNNRGHLW